MPLLNTAPFPRNIRFPFLMDLPNSIPEALEAKRARLACSLVAGLPLMTPLSKARSESVGEGGREDVQGWMDGWMDGRLQRLLFPFHSSFIHDLLKLMFRLGNCGIGLLFAQRRCPRCTCFVCRASFESESAVPTRRKRTCRSAVQSDMIFTTERGGNSCLGQQQQQRSFLSLDV